MPYFDPDFDPITCESIDELRFQIRALATDLHVRGVGLCSEPLDLARDVYSVLLTLRAREERARETGLREQEARFKGRDHKGEVP